MSRHNKPLAHEAEFKVFADITTPKEAAAIWHYSERTVRGWCDAGYVAAAQFDGRWIIYLPSLKAFLARREKRVKMGYGGRTAYKRQDL